MNSIKGIDRQSTVSIQFHHVLVNICIIVKWEYIHTNTQINIIFNIVVVVDCSSIINSIEWVGVTRIIFPGYDFIDRIILSENSLIQFIVFITFQRNINIIIPWNVSLVSYCSEQSAIS